MDRAGLRQKLFHSIGARLILYLSCLFLIIAFISKTADIMGIPYTTYTGTWGHVKDEVSRGLKLVADLKKERLLRWIQEQRVNIHVISYNETMAARVLLLKNPAKRKESLNRLLDQLNGIKSYYGVYDRIRIVDPESQIIIISTDKAEVGTNNADRDCFRKALETNMDCIEDVAFDPQSHIPVLHITHALTGGQGKAVGVIIAEINLNQIIDPVLNVKGRLGESGEVELVNREASILTSLEYPLPDGSKPRPLMYRLTTTSARLAASGKEGFIEARDYRGVPVLAAYRYIRVTPQWGWGMVVKRDVSEVYAPFRKDMLCTLLIDLVLILIFIGLIVILVKSITHPISSLSEAAEKITEGNLDVRAPVLRSDEVGNLAKTFNRMVGRIQNWHKELEANVKTRTSELTKEINERKRLEDALRKERDNAQNYLDIVGVMVVLLNTDGTVSLINKKGCEILGYHHCNEIIGKNWFDNFVPERFRGEVKNIFARLMVGEVTPVEYYENPVLSIDGEERVISWRNVLVRDENGKVTGTLSSGEDITDHKRYEETIRASEEKFRTLFEKAEIGIVFGKAEFMPDKREYLINVNPAMQKFLGYSEEELRGMSVIDISYPADMLKNAELFDELMAGKRHSFEMDKRYIRKDGQVVWGHLTVAPVRDAAGKIIYTIATIQDITDRKHYEDALRDSEERFRTLFEKAEIGITLGKPGFTPEKKEYLIMCNPAMQKFLGYTEDEFKRMSVKDFSYPDPAELNYSAESFKELDAGKLDKFEIDKRYIRKDGQVAWGHLTVAPVRDAAGKIIYTIATIQDITKRKRAEDELRKAHDELEQRVEKRTAELKAANEQLVHAEKLSALGQMAASISHEFNNPIYGIEMVLEQLKEEADLMEEHRKAVDLALRESKRVARMVQNLQDFYQPSSGLIIPLDVNHTIEEVLEIYGRKLKVSNIDVVKDLAGNMPPVPAVADQIKQVFLNIMANAEESMAPVGGTLDIQTKILDSKVQIIFKDTGHGIAKENIRKLFSPFFTTKREVKGTGLGLAVSYGIIRKHGGNILVESVLNKGSVFTIELPLAGHVRSEI